MVLALAGHDEHGNPAAAARPEAVFAELWHRDLAADNGSADGSAEGHKTVPLEVRARPHGGFEASAVLTAAGNFEVKFRLALQCNFSCPGYDMQRRPCIMSSTPVEHPIIQIRGHLETFETGRVLLYDVRTYQCTCRWWRASAVPRQL